MKVLFLKAKASLFAVALVGLVVVCAFTAYLSGAVTVYSAQARKLPIYSVEREDKKIAISFDCAWGVERTDAILSALQEKKVRATFFPVQFWSEKYPEYLKKIDEAGHEIGTHSATHSYMSKLSQTEIVAELKTSSEAITKITGKPVELFRPPYGDYDDLLIQTCEEQGVFPIQWDVDSLDWKDLSASDIAARILKRVKSGSIILCHNNGLHTAEALPLVLDGLLAQGYTFVPIGELIYKSHYSVDHTGRQFPKAAA